MRAFLFSISAFALTACASGANGSDGASGLQSFSVDQGPCFGFCPVYAITVEADNSFSLDNRRHTREEGLVAGRLDAGAFDTIADAAARVNFRDLPEDMTFNNPEACTGPQMSDMPYFEFTGVYADGTEKTVRWYQGCNYPGMREFMGAVREAYDYDTRIERARE